MARMSERNNGNAYFVFVNYAGKKNCEYSDPKKMCRRMKDLKAEGFKVASFRVNGRGGYSAVMSFEREPFGCNTPGYQEVVKWNVPWREGLEYHGYPCSRDVGE